MRTKLSRFTVWRLLRQEETTLNRKGRPRTPRIFRGKNLRVKCIRPIGNGFETVYMLAQKLHRLEISTTQSLVLIHRVIKVGFTRVHGD